MAEGAIAHPPCAEGLQNMISTNKIDPAVACYVPDLLLGRTGILGSSLSFPFTPIGPCPELPSFHAPDPAFELDAETQIDEADTSPF